MELYETVSPEERRLRDKAAELHSPIGGTFELTPLCNMDCEMCYVRLTPKEMEKRGTLLSCDKWIDIARQGADEGLLFVLLTGGEPFLYPEFERLFSTLRSMGMIVSLNTNGTLIDEKRADFLAREGVRRVNITLYGKDNDTYASVCKNPKGFTQVTRGFKLLKERDIAFRITVSLTKKNMEDLPFIREVAERYEVPLQPAAYMFPSLRRQDNAKESRMDAKSAAKAVVESYRLKNPNVDLSTAARQTLYQIGLPSRIPEKGFSCTAGNSGFWINWKGDMSPCGMFEDPKISLTDHSFKEGWDFTISETMKMKQCDECKNCRFVNVCQVCPAACLAETGQTEKKPKYVCDMTREMVHIMSNLAGLDGNINAIPEIEEI